LLLRLTRLDSLRYFKRRTGRLAGTKRELARNAMLALDCLDLNHRDGQIAFRETIRQCNQLRLHFIFSLFNRLRLLKKLQSIVIDYD